MYNIYRWNNVSNLLGLKIILLLFINLECLIYYVKNFLLDRSY